MYVLSNFELYTILIHFVYMSILAAHVVTCRFICVVCFIVNYIYHDVTVPLIHTRGRDV